MIALATSLENPSPDIHRSQEGMSTKERDFINTMVAAIRANSTDPSLNVFLDQNKDLINAKFSYQGKKRTILEIAKLEKKPGLVKLIAEFKANNTKEKRHSSTVHHRETAQRLTRTSGKNVA